MHIPALQLARSAFASALLILFLARAAPAQNPGRTWQRFATPEHAGWSARMLEQAFKTSGAAAMMLVQDGRVVATFGDVARRFKCHSIRKSLLSALYGPRVRSGDIALEKTLKELRIEDRVPLTDEELLARVVDLLRSSSGVYLPAAAETATMGTLRPGRGSHAPGSFWYYNNWDFNVLGTIFERETGRDLFVEFQERIAIPLQMEDFRLLDGAHDYSESDLSIHPSYPFKMSARDLARFGQLYLQRGRWNAAQLIPEQWIGESTKRHFEVTSEGPGYTGYGYLWWLDETPELPHSFFASGYGGQYVGVFPAERLIIVLLADTYRDQRSAVIADRAHTIREILGAKTDRPAGKPEFVPLEIPPTGPWPCLERKQLERVAGTYTGEYEDLFAPAPSMQAGDYQDHTFFVMARGDGLFLERFDDYYRHRLLPTGDDTFFAEDLGVSLVFDATDPAGKASPVFCTDPRFVDLYRTIAARGPAPGQRRIEDLLTPNPVDPFDLKLLAWNFKREGRMHDAAEVLRLNVLRFPQSIDTHREFLNTMRLSKASVAERAGDYAALVDELIRQNANPELARWFHQWLDARAHPEEIPEPEAAACAGTYGDRHVAAEGRSLYYLRGESAHAIRYRLLKAADGSFVIDDDFLDGARFAFTRSEASRAATMTVVSIDGRRTEIVRR
jgi:CubicO group peptidase (beta-lactamase class C family)